jgi:hypothetical protein
MKYISSICATLLISVSAYCQNAEDAKKIFPDESVIMLKSSLQLNIKMKNGEPVAEGDRESEKLLLNSKTAEFFSKGKVFHSSFGELTKIEAYSLVPNGNKYKKLKVEEFKTTDNSNSGSVFYDDAKETTFEYQGLTENAITHVSYSQFYKDAHMLPTFYFRGFLPTVSFSYTVTFPNDIELKYFIRNDENHIIHVSEEKKKKETVYTFTANNVKDLDSFSDAPSDQYYEPHVIVYISSIKRENSTESFLNTLDDLYKWNYSFTKELNLSVDSELKKIVDSLTNGLSSETDKAKKIYRWVQENIKYIAFEDGIEGLRPRQAGEVCSKRYGDCKDMSSIITQMLKLAGIKAYYTWIGTRELPYDYTDVHLPVVDDHMISTANIDGKWIFLDGTDPNGVFGVPGAFIQDKEALIAINEKEYKVLRVPVAEASQNLIIDSTAFTITEKGLKGFENVYYYGYVGNEAYNTLQYKDDNGVREYVKSRMTKGSNKFLIGDYKINKVNPAKNIININTPFELPEYGKKIGDEYYINLNLEKLLENQVIDTSKRKVAMQMKYKYLVKEYHILQIPDGFKVSYTPPNFSFENDLFKLKITYQNVNNTIMALQEVESKRLMVKVSEFDEWNKAIRTIQPHYKEAVVLSKK